MRFALFAVLLLALPLPAADVPWSFNERLTNVEKDVQDLKYRMSGIESRVSVIERKFAPQIAEAPPVYRTKVPCEVQYREIPVQTWTPREVAVPSLPFTMQGTTARTVGVSSTSYPVEMQTAPILIGAPYVVPPGGTVRYGGGYSTGNCPTGPGFSAGFGFTGRRGGGFGAGFGFGGGAPG